MTIRNSIRFLAAGGLLLASAAGCETKAGSGAIIGGLAGGALGGVIGHQSGEAVAGAAIGAGVGAVGGALVGNEMDKADARKERQRQAERYERESRYSDRRGDSYGYEPRSSGVILQRDIIEWTRSGVRDEVIIDRIQRSGQVFRLTAAEESELRDAGVSSRVIQAMRDTARRY
ncbi:MAG: glycine zipper domain-containing protein [Phycisphaerae bacterium]|nr:glycine zipper domain-containing protein [Phycisphaerae bacterium]MDW8262021.1 glycine zipper domain-containing protein [Phycisphaerales bacterium]